MSVYHGIALSLRTLKRRLRQLDLSRRNQPSSLNDIWHAIEHELCGPGVEIFVNYRSSV